MKKIYIMVCLAIMAGHLYGQDYLITFSGTGGSTAVDAVLVQNLTQGTSLAIQGADTLRLQATLGVPLTRKPDLQLQVYPNPVLQNATLNVHVSIASVVKITILSADGKLIYRLDKSLRQGLHSFRLNGFPTGCYIVNIESEYQSGSLAFISAGSGRTSGGLHYAGSNENFSSDIQLKSSSGIVPMQYNAGDQLLFTGSADIFATVFPFVPTASAEISFFFVEATDGDGNHYPTVAIGSKIWLARNLMTTKYTDGGAIEFPGTDNNAWLTNTSGAYAWYDNDIGNKDIYGALYNWYAVDTSILCPAGWHIPDDAEWNVLTDFLGGMDIAGGKLKETGLLHWADPNLDATNETGFTALPGGNRNGDGSFSLLGSSGNWWSATSEILGAYDRHLYNSNGSIYRQLYGMNMGFSVRCVRN